MSDILDNTPTLRVEDALKRGYRPLTQPYRLEKERWMAVNALSDLKGCNVVLVETSEGPEIWRAAAELSLIS